MKNNTCQYGQLILLVAQICLERIVGFVNSYNYTKKCITENKQCLTQKHEYLAARSAIINTNKLKQLNCL